MSSARGLLYIFRMFTPERTKAMPMTTAMPHSKMLSDGPQMTSVEILYQTPGRPHLIQSFLWQDYDVAPEFPRLKRFLRFWAERFGVTVHSIHLIEQEETSPAEAHYMGYSLVVH
jgi:uncharacterized protein Usg